MSLRRLTWSLSVDHWFGSLTSGSCFCVIVSAHCLHYGSGDVKVTVDEAELQNCKAKQAHLEHKMSDMVRTVGDLAITVRDLRRTVKALNGKHVERQDI